MKSVLFFLFISSLLGLSNSNNDCSEFKVGRYIYLNKEENQFDRTHIAIRTTNRQIYIDSEKGDTLIYDLKWISNCEYELIYTKSNLKKEGFVKIGDTLSVSIEPIDNMTFNYTSKIKENGFEREFKGTMKKIE
jgi:hypothetical protein